MTSVSADLFAEDQAHEAFVRPMIERIAREEGDAAAVRVVSARGGHGRAIEEFRLYQRAAERSQSGFPDLVVVAIDANCKPWNQARADIHASVDTQVSAAVIVACPDPHIERWFLADPESSCEVVGAAPRQEKYKCERGRYKMLLRDAVKDGGNPATLGGIEFAKELVDAMDLYRAGRNEPSLRAFVNESRDTLRRLLLTRRANA